MTMRTKTALSIYTFVVGTMGVNCYVLADPATREAIIIDPGDDSAYITDRIQALNVRPTTVIATHGHFDHIMAAFAVQQTFHIPFVVHGSDVFLVSRMGESARHFLGLLVVDPPPVCSRTIGEGDTVRLGKNTLTVLHTPGHTPGSISLYHKPSNLLVCGDLLFAGGGVGRTDFSYSSQILLKKSIGRVLGLPESTVLYCGHGPIATVKEELPSFAESHGRPTPPK